MEEKTKTVCLSLLQRDEKEGKNRILQTRRKQRASLGQFREWGGPDKVDGNLLGVGGSNTVARTPWQLGAPEETRLALVGAGRLRGVARVRRPGMVGGGTGQEMNSPKKGGRGGRPTSKSSEPR